MRRMLSFVIPCYHSEETLGSVVDDIIATVEADGRYDFEIILVNDNPPDATWRLIERLAAADRRIRGVCMMRNFGQHAALMAGLRMVEGDIAVCLDDDGQTPPRETFKLVDALTAPGASVDAVYADYPEAHKFANLFRRLGSNLADGMATALIGKPRDLYMSSFIALRRQIVDEVVRYTGPYPYVDGLILRSSGTVINVPTDHRERACGSSGYSFKKLVQLWLNGFTAFSIKPLRGAALLGGLLAFAGLVVAVVMVIRKLFLGAAIDPGWTSLVVLILLVGGAIIAMLGLVGEYVGRTYLSINDTPQYIVRETTGAACEARCKTPRDPEGAAR